MLPGMRVEYIVHHGCRAPHRAPRPRRDAEAQPLWSSLTFGTYWSRWSFQTPLPGPSRLPHGACPAWKPIFSRGPRGPRSALRCLHVHRGHLSQEVGKFGCGRGKVETFHEGGIRTKAGLVTPCKAWGPRRQSQPQHNNTAAPTAPRLGRVPPLAGLSVGGDRHCLWGQAACCVALDEPLDLSEPSFPCL